MERLITSNLKLGIIAGGQLAKMLIQEASKWDIATYVLDREKDCPAGSIASCLVSGSQTDFDDVYNFGKMVDVLTYEMENINIDALKKLKSEGVVIKPDPDVLEMIQDKGLQKEFYSTNGIPTSPYVFVDGADEINEKIKTGEIEFPFVQKIRKGGYDGQGVAVVNSPGELGKTLNGASIIENKIDIDKEIAVIAARNGNGDISCFPVVEMVFNDKANLVDKLICPSTITTGQAEKAIGMASQIIGLLNMEGLLAVEFFVDKNGEVIVNEMAPRPHNSGHHSIESIITSQFEQHLRSILNLPLGSTQLKLPAVMLNIIGEEGCQGMVKYEGLTESMAIPGVKVHLYGKKETRPFRKMGHVTILSENMNDALKKADKVKELLKVKSWEKK